MKQHYKIKGITEDVTICDCCNKKNLKRTIALEVWENQENSLEIIYVGVDCAEILLKKSGRNLSANKIKKQAIQISEAQKAAEKYATEQLNWKINNRIQNNKADALVNFFKQYPLYPSRGKPDFGCLYVKNDKFAVVATGKSGEVESRFIDYLKTEGFTESYVD